VKGFLNLVQILMESNQKDAFVNYEADAWFDRNQQMAENYIGSADHVLKVLQNYSIDPSTVLEIGCSSGYRLNAIKQLYPTAEVFGVEPSRKAVGYGRSKYPDINLEIGTADDLKMYKNEQMELVIIGFIFYVIDRNILFKVIAEIDRVLKSGGSLIIVDFFSPYPVRNEYHHITEFKAFSFKQQYEDIFTASGIYQLLHKESIDHSKKTLSASSDYSNLYSVTLLRKDMQSGYREVTL
jgi:ubiquinone/menaquinone biosynthesis C-methylase UbiE